MTVKRIVTNIAVDDTARAAAFYRELLDLELVMDLGWIVTLAADATCAPQLSVMIKNGSGSPVPDISIEVDDVDEVYRKASDGGHPILYDLVDEPWGVRRFYVQDPFGKTLNILSHRS